MSTAPKFLTHYTVEDYRLWKGDWELWHGVAVSMTPSPFGSHSRLLVKLATALEIAVRSAGCNASVLAEIDWILADDMVLRPDLLIVCGKEPARHVVHVPALVSEILSASTRARDVHEKKGIYRDKGVKWYLIADPEQGTLEAMRLNDQGRYEPVAFQESLAIDICNECILDVDVSGLFR